MSNQLPDQYPQLPQTPTLGAPALYRPPIAPAEHQLNPYEDKQWGTFAHMSGLVGFIPALVIYQTYKDRGRFARQESAEALNFQITIIAAYFVCMVFSLIPVIGLLFTLGMMALWVANIVLSILAGMSANKGEPYRYPMPIRFVN